LSRALGGGAKAGDEDVELLDAAGSSAAELAISCVEAVVCCVEAETCSVAAEASSAAMRYRRSPWAAAGEGLRRLRAA
jgi:hypothetical protein